MALLSTNLDLIYSSMMNLNSLRGRQIGLIYQISSTLKKVALITLTIRVFKLYSLQGQIATINLLLYPINQMLHCLGESIVKIWQYKIWSLNWRIPIQDHLKSISNIKVSIVLPKQEKILKSKLKSKKEYSVQLWHLPRKKC